MYLLEFLKNKRGNSNLSTVIKTIALTVIGALVLSGMSYIVVNVLDSTDDNYKDTFSGLKSDTKPTAGSNSEGGGLYNSAKKIVSWDDIKVAYLEYKEVNPDCNDMDFEAGYIYVLNNDVFSKFSKEPCNELVIDSSVSCFGKSSKSKTMDNITSVLDSLNTLTFSNGVQKICGILSDNGGKIETINFENSIKELNCSIQITNLKRINYSGTVKEFKTIPGCKTMPVTVYCSDGRYNPEGGAADYKLNYEWKVDISSACDNSLTAYCVKGDIISHDALTNNTVYGYTVYIDGNGYPIDPFASKTVTYKSGNTTTVSDNYPWAYGALSEWDYDNKQITRFKVYNGMSLIPERFFQSCKYLHEIDLPNSITSIGENVFSGCTSLVSFTVPSNVTDISSYAFDDSCLEKILVSNKNTKYVSHNGVLFDSSGETLIRVPPCYGCEEYYESASYVYTLPELQTPYTIKTGAFQGTQYITELETGDAVIGRIERNAFSDSYLYNDSNNWYEEYGPDYVSEKLVIDHRYLIEVKPRTSGTSYHVTTFAQYAEFYTLIADGAFDELTTVSDFYIPKDISYLHIDTAFYNCSQLVNIYYYGTVSDWNNMTGYSVGDAMSTFGVNIITDCTS